MFVVVVDAVTYLARFEHKLNPKICLCTANRCLYASASLWTGLHVDALWTCECISLGKYGRHVPVHRQPDFSQVSWWLDSHTRRLADTSESVSRQSTQTWVYIDYMPIWWRALVPVCTNLTVWKQFSSLHTLSLLLHRTQIFGAERQTRQKCIKSAIVLLHGAQAPHCLVAIDDATRENTRDDNESESHRVVIHWNSPWITGCAGTHTGIQRRHLLINASKCACETLTISPTVNRMASNAFLKSQVTSINSSLECALRSPPFTSCAACRRATKFLGQWRMENGRLHVAHQPHLKMIIASTPFHRRLLHNADISLHPLGFGCAFEMSTSNGGDDSHAKCMAAYFVHFIQCSGRRVLSHKAAMSSWQKMM